MLLNDITVGVGLHLGYYGRNIHEPLTRYVNFRVAHAPGMPGTFSPPPQVSDTDMHHGMGLTVMHAGIAN